jgi:hypothetical protein
MNRPNGQTMHVITIRAPTRAKLTRYGARRHSTRVLIMLLVAANNVQSRDSINQFSKSTLACDIFPGTYTEILSPEPRHIVHMTATYVSKEGQGDDASLPRHTHVLQLGRHVRDHLCLRVRQPIYSS